MKKTPDTTTIQITAETKKLLESLKKYRRETYNDLIMRILEERGETRTRKKENTGKLEQEMRKSLDEIKAGKFKTQEQLGAELEF